MSDLENKENNEPNNRDRETLLMQYNNQIGNFKAEIEKIQYEIETLQKAVTQKKHCLQTCVEDSKSNKKTIINEIKRINKYNESIIKKIKETRERQERWKINAKDCLNAQFSEVSQKYELARLEIQKHKQQENILATKLENLRSQLRVHSENCASMEADEHYKEVEYEQNNVRENDSYKQEIAKLKLKVKRLEIKTTSLESFLEKKAEECVALAELNDEIVARQPV